MKHLRYQLEILTLSCLAGWAATSAAQDSDTESLEAQVLPRYAVELIVFRRQELTRAYPEDFSPQGAPQSHDIAEATETGDDAITPPGDFAVDDKDGEAQPPPVLEYELIPDELLALTEIFDRLAKLDHYEPLLHVGWVQTGHEDKMALPFEIAVVSEDDTFLSGTVTLRRSRFLHLDVNFILEQTGATAYRVHENRKIAPPYPTHYFDHPAMSVIARVNRFEASEQPPLEQDLPEGLPTTP